LFTAAGCWLPSNPARGDKDRMTNPEQAPDKLWVAVQDDTAFVHVQGRGSFKISSALKQFGGAVIEQGCRQIIFDMVKCIGMDSTFMGVLAGIALRLKEKTGGEIIMVNLSLRTRGLLATLGLDQIIQPQMVGTMSESLQKVLAASGRLAELQSPSETRMETAETMLEAHENLVQLTPENVPKFKDVLTFLREDLKKAREEGGGKT
jgi:anti-sigma B factor antagonist